MEIHGRLPPETEMSVTKPLLNSDRLGWGGGGGEGLYIIETELSDES
jgi:hypothetical protein